MKKLKLLEEYTITELEDIIERRKKIDQPVPLTISAAQQQQRYNDLVKVCIDYIDALVDGADGSDQEYFIFERALELVYGGLIWGWVNEQL